MSPWLERARVWSRISTSNGLEAPGDWVEDEDITVTDETASRIRENIEKANLKGKGKGKEKKRHDVFELGTVAAAEKEYSIQNIQNI